MMDRSSNIEHNSEVDLRPSLDEQIERSNTDGGFSIFDAESIGFSRTMSEASTFSETHDESSSYSESPRLGWPIAKYETPRSTILTKLGMKRVDVLDEKSDYQETNYSEMEMMKERFSKLLLGEDMSGSGKGVSTAVAISNAITNLYATVFGQFWKLEPLSPEKKSMWRREMDWLLCVCDFIVELVPSSQSFLDGTSHEVMASKPRSDISINLPALQKLDTMLLEILDSFSNTEFWYIDQGILSSNINNSASFRKSFHRPEEKWWLPTPCVPPCGLSEKSRKFLQKKRRCVNQILKAAMAINSSVLAEMEVPETYSAALPKSGKSSLGDAIHRYITTMDQFSPDYLLDHLDIKSEHEALEVADRVEAAICIWRRKICMNNTKSSWVMVKDLMADGDRVEKIEMLTRVETLLLCLKQRYPGLSQTTLDMSKIQYNKIAQFRGKIGRFGDLTAQTAVGIMNPGFFLNPRFQYQEGFEYNDSIRSGVTKVIERLAPNVTFAIEATREDVGQAILESYSRVLESLAFTIVAWIQDVLSVDGSKKHSDR